MCACVSCTSPPIADAEDGARVLPLAAGSGAFALGADEGLSSRFHVLFTALLGIHRVGALEYAQEET